MLEKNLQSFHLLDNWLNTDSEWFMILTTGWFELGKERNNGFSSFLWITNVQCKNIFISIVFFVEVETFAEVCGQFQEENCSL